MGRAYEPYLPRSGTEGADFQADWCRKCKADADYPDGDGCDILARSFCGIQPDEWRLERGEPACTAFEAIDPSDQPFMHNAVVKNLFPSHPTMPTYGEQIRMLMDNVLEGTPQ